MAKHELADVNLNLLVALDALLQERSVTRAAARTSVTPSAMSHSLSELRVLFSDPLLLRVGRGMALSPRAEQMQLPLQQLLLELSRVVHDAGAFDPRTTQRRFVIAAPDFLAVLLLPELVQAAGADAPGLSFEIVPSARRGNAWRLESGEVDLALGAAVDDAPGIRRMDLCTEGFACAVRKDHPGVRGKLELDTYTRFPHLVISLGDDDAPTWIDEALAKLGRSRRVVARTRYFMNAPLVVARSELILTGPSMLIRYFAQLVPLQVFTPPIPLPTYSEEAFWHERVESDPAHRFLRELVKRALQGKGLAQGPERRRFRAAENAAAKTKRRKSSARTRSSTRASTA